MANNRAGGFLGGFLLGAAAGVVAGLLVAPRSGRETRQLLKKSADALPELAEDLSSTVQLQADRLSESATRSWESTLGRLKEAISIGLETGKREHQALLDPENGSRSPALEYDAASETLKTLPEE